MTREQSAIATLLSDASGELVDSMTNAVTDLCIKQATRLCENQHLRSDLIVALQIPGGVYTPNPAPDGHPCNAADRVTD